MPDALVTLNQTWNQEYAANVLGFSNVQEDTQWLRDFADAIRFSYDANLAPVLSNQHFLEDLSVGFIVGGSIAYSVDVPFTGGPAQGNQAGDVVANQTALLVSTNYIGPRPNRGRVYLCGFTEAEMSDGRWDTGTTQAAFNFIADMVNGIGPQGSLAFLRIVGRPGANGGLYVTNPVDTIVAQPIPATQRRRRLGAQ